MCIAVYKERWIYTKIILDFINKLITMLILSHLNIQKWGNARLIRWIIHSVNQKLALLVWWGYDKWKIE